MDTFPIRINKYLAHKGTSTRTGADELIRQGKVLINGKQAKLGDYVREGDDVHVVGNHRKKEYTYLAYNKPTGIVSTNPQGTEKGITDTVSYTKKLFPVGRLDKDSHGLILLTDDGRITDRLLNPIYHHEKEYTVEVNRAFSPAFLKHMSEGVKIGDYITKPAKVTRLNATKFNIILTEGKNRQIRRMTEALGYTVIDLCRIRIQNIGLNKMHRGAYREITGTEKEVFLKSIGLS
ncbi:MAG: rRNA pseudouridine2604 synthase [Patescibacteria group bacterium]|nr:rRNA pseudouridine2604 synthase [Patescibacteria group bacterium]